MSLRISIRQRIAIIPSTTISLFTAGGAVEIPVEIRTAGTYTVEVVAWADQAGNEFPRLNAVVEAVSGPGAGADAIRQKLVELHDKLLGVQVTPSSPDVEAAYELFVNVWKRRRELQADDSWKLRDWACGLGDIFYFEGILDDVIVRHENEFGDIWFDFDWGRIDTFWNGIDLADPQAVAQTWVVVLAYLSDGLPIPLLVGG